MSKADAKQYFLDIERQYNEIKELLEDVSEYYNKGEMTKEQLDDTIATFNRAQMVYETARIFMHKLNARKNKPTTDVVEIPENFNKEESK